MYQEIDFMSLRMFDLLCAIYSVLALLLGPFRIKV